MPRLLDAGRGPARCLVAPPIGHVHSPSTWDQPHAVGLQPAQDLLRFLGRGRGGVIGLGAANLGAGFFQGFPISSSSSRTPVAEAAGAKTQLTGVVGSIAVALLLLFAPNLLKDLPSSALAAIVIAAAIGLFEFADLRRIFRIQPWEFWLSIVCFVGVAVFGVIPGIGIAIGIAVIEFLWDGWRPHYAVLGRVDGVRGCPTSSAILLRAAFPAWCCFVGTRLLLR